MSQAPHLSELELDKLAAGATPTAAQQAALDASEKLRADLALRRKGFNAWPELDERKILAKVRTAAAAPPAPDSIFAGWFQLRSAFAGAAAAVMLMGAWSMFNATDAGPPEPIATPEIDTQRTTTLADGSTVVTPPDAKVVMERVSARSTALRLDEGQASFSVTPNPERTFQVRVNDVSVHVVGTTFDVFREPPNVRVAVTEGKVRVVWPEGERILTDNEQSEFPMNAAAAPPPLPEILPAPTEEPEEEPIEEAPPTKARPQGQASWKTLVKRGQHDAAYAALKDSGARVQNNVSELMLAADAARLSGHPDAAATYLMKVVEEHSRDPRAPLAAFTLGGVYLRSLKDPVSAATHYKRARELAPKGALAGDALAREVEARSRAGEKDVASKLAQEYLDTYPDGPRTRAVKRFGGLP